MHREHSQPGNTQIVALNDSQFTALRESQFLLGLYCAHSANCVGQGEGGGAISRVEVQSRHRATGAWQRRHVRAHTTCVCVCQVARRPMHLQLQRLTFSGLTVCVPHIHLLLLAQAYGSD